MRALLIFYKTLVGNISDESKDKTDRRHVFTVSTQLKENQWRTVLAWFASLPIGYEQVFGDLPAHGCGHCLGIHSTVDKCEFCVFFPAPGGGQYMTKHMVKIAAHLAQWCCTATTMALTEVKGE